MMKYFFVSLLVALTLFLAAPLTAQADQFSDLAQSPYAYWVPNPTPPPPGYAAGPNAPYYYGPPPPYYYYGPPPPVVVAGPRFFFGFRFH